MDHLSRDRNYKNISKASSTTKPKTSSVPNSRNVPKSGSLNGANMNVHSKSNADKRKVRIYNNAKLSIHPRDTVVICDWDDTLFPTSWVNEQNINLTDIRSRYMYARYFDSLDKHLFATIRRIKKYADLIIITNATKQWLQITLTVLPKTKELLDDVPIISAREAFQHQCGIQDWKKHTFKAELSKDGRTHYKNIVSLGDANYEHNALIGLYRWDVIPLKYLKSVKFTRSADYSDLFGQLQMISNEIKNIILAQRHLDLTLDVIRLDK